MRLFFEEGDVSLPWVAFLRVVYSQLIIPAVSFALFLAASSRGSVADGRRNHVASHPFAKIWKGSSALLSLLLSPCPFALLTDNPSLDLFLFSSRSFPPMPQLRNGTLITLPPSLVPRLKSHFHTLPCGVDLILGLNGYIWISMHVPTPEELGEAGEGGKEEQAAAGGFDVDGEGVYSGKNDVRLAVSLSKCRQVAFGC
jgi:hypothetical protein